MKKRVKAFAPATVANVSCGFDIFGLALEHPGDEIVLNLKDEPGIRINRIYGDNGRLPKEAEKNTAGIAIMSFLKHLQLELGIEMELHKGLPLGSGLGSSAASAVAALKGLNFLLKEPLSDKELIPFALDAEKAISGTGHADNVAPSLLGGFVIVRSYDPLDIVKLNVRDDLYCVVIHPDIEIMTKIARDILPTQVNLKDAVTQWGNIAGVVAGLLNNDYDLLSRSMNDIIVEPVRAELIPYFYEVKKSALSEGALGCSISGSGPSVFALCKTRTIAEAVGKKMKDIYDRRNIKNDLYISGINNKGAIAEQID